MKRKRIHLLGSCLDCLTMTETLQQVECLVEKRMITQHVAINAGKINLIAKNRRLGEIVKQSALVNADGNGIVWAANWLGYNVPERVAGIDLFQAIIPLAAKKGWRLYYFGATDKVVQSVINKHQQLYPELIVAGFRSGYFKDEESFDIAEEIRLSQADVLFVAFPSPKKEYWLHKYKDQMQVPFVMGVGGSFDVIAGKTKRAPLWMQKAGFEWFYRFYQEPKRMFRRYMIGNFQFIRRVWQAKYIQKQERNNE